MMGRLFNLASVTVRIGLAERVLLGEAAQRQGLAWHEAVERLQGVALKAATEAVRCEIRRLAAAAPVAAAAVAAAAESAAPPRGESVAYWWCGCGETVTLGVRECPRCGEERDERVAQSVAAARRADRR